jgi:hypothetical protein
MSIHLSRVTGSVVPRLAAMLSSVFCIGCESSSIPRNQPEESSMYVLTVSDLTDGVETLIGTITFDDANNGTLATEINGPEADRLREAWDEMSKRDSLILQRNERKEVDGEMVTANVARTVRKGDERYPDAVWSHMEKYYGFLVDKK